MVQQVVAPDARPGRLRSVASLEDAAPRFTGPLEVTGVHGEEATACGAPWRRRAPADHRLRRRSGLRSKRRAPCSPPRGLWPCLRHFKGYVLWLRRYRSCCCTRCTTCPQTLAWPCCCAASGTAPTAPRPCLVIARVAK